METLKVINQNKYFKVIKVFVGIRFINVQKVGVRININGELFYKLLTRIILKKSKINDNQFVFISYLFRFF